MNIVEAFVIVVEYLLKDSTNAEFRKFLEDVLESLKCRGFDQESSPRHMSIVKFGYNIFPLTDNQYIEIARYIKDMP